MTCLSSEHDYNTLYVTPDDIKDQIIPNSLEGISQPLNGRYVLLAHSPT